MPTCSSAGKSSLIIKDKPEDTKDSLIWKWLKGDATTQTDFADPTTMTPYHLCLYAGTAASIADIELPAGSPSWKATGTKGFKYKDKTTAVDGIKKVVLKGGDAGKAKVIVQGKGAMIPDLSPPFALPVVARIINGDSGACWASSFASSHVVKNESGLFKAKSP